MTKKNILWSIVMANLTLNEWFNFDQIVAMVESVFPHFTVKDQQRHKTTSEILWKKNLREVMVRKAELSVIEFNTNLGFRIVRPFIWRMVREAVDNGNQTYGEIQAYINRNWVNVNQSTIIAQTVVLSVNHTSRAHYPENQKARRTDTGSPYDYLFYTGRGQVNKYNVSEHGVWEIYTSEIQIASIRLFDKKIYSPGDISWFKSVTNTEIGEAYLDVSSPDFTLNFPTSKLNNAESPEVGEIILIYQKLNGRPYFTHLVTPVGGNIVDENLCSEYRYGRTVKIIAITGRDNAIPVKSTLLGKQRLMGVTQGTVCRIDHMKNINNLEALQWDLWEHFKDYFVIEEQQSIVTVAALVNEIENTTSATSVVEGGLKLVKHFIRERNRKIVDEKKRLATLNSTLYCEVCSFSFPQKFGKDFIECHHRKPISESGETKTSLDDLALVCANCHRMLHMKFEGQYLTTENLRIRF